MMNQNILQTLLETGLLSRPIYEKLKSHPDAIYYLLTRKYMPPSDETDRVLVGFPSWRRSRNLIHIPGYRITWNTTKPILDYSSETL